MHLVCLRYMPQVRNKSVSLFFFVCYTSMYLYGVVPNDTYRIGTSREASDWFCSVVQSDLIGFVQLYTVIWLVCSVVQSDLIGFVQLYTVILLVLFSCTQWFDWFWSVLQSDLIDFVQLDIATQYHNATSNIELDRVSAWTPPLPWQQWLITRANGRLL